MTGSYITAWIANFAFIGLKAFQQRNVIHGNHLAVVLTSQLLAGVEVLVIWKIAKTAATLQDYTLLVLTLGTSGGLGCLLAMHLHDKHFKRDTK